MSSKQKIVIFVTKTFQNMSDISGVFTPASFEMNILVLDRFIQLQLYIIE